jgi:hypothetical protein
MKCRRCWGITVLALALPISFPSRPVDPSGTAAQSAHPITLDEIMSFREVKEPRRSQEGSVPKTLVEEITYVGEAMVEHAKYLLEAFAVLAAMVAIAISLVFLLAYIHVELGCLPARDTSICGSLATADEISAKSSFDVSSRVS